MPLHSVRLLVRVAVGFAALPTIAASAAAQDIDTARLGVDARALSADSMEGRASGSAGQRAAAAYIVARLDSLGFRGFAPDGGYLQQIPLTAAHVAPDSTRLIVRGDTGPADTISSRDFHHLGGGRASFAPAAGALVYGGTMADAVKSSPQSSNGPVLLAVRSTPGVSIDSLLARLDTGSIRAVIVIVPNERFYQRLRVVRGPTRFIAPLDAGAPDIPVLVASPAVAARLGLDDMAPGTRLAPRAALETSVRFADTSAANIVAHIPGRRPGRAVLYLAHYDHIGFGEPEDGDSLYNGFIDNAVGAAAVLGIAQAFHEVPPAGPVILLFPAAEEEGSLGSAWFAEHPPLPLDSIAAAINIDAGAPLAPPRTWRLEGGSADPVWQTADSVARSRGRSARLVPAMQNSDHWSLLSRGVPSVLLAFDDDWEGVTAEERDALIARWWRAHRPDDEWAADFPLAGLARYADFALQIGYAISAGATR